MHRRLFEFAGREHVCPMHEPIKRQFARVRGLLLAVVVVTIMLRSVRVIRQQQVGVVERLGKFRRTLEPGPHLLVPVIPLGAPQH